MTFKLTVDLGNVGIMVERESGGEREVMSEISPNLANKRSRQIDYGSKSFVCRVLRKLGDLGMG